MYGPSKGSAYTRVGLYASIYGIGLTQQNIFPWRTKFGEIDPLHRARKKVCGKKSLKIITPKR